MAMKFTFHKQIGLFSCALLLFLALWGVRALYLFRICANVYPIHIRLTTAPSNMSDNIMVTLTSVLGSKLNLERGTGFKRAWGLIDEKRNTWSVGDGGTRCVSAMHISLPAGLASTALIVEYTFGDVMFSRDWQPITPQFVMQSNGQNIFKLPITYPGSSFKRAYSNKIINWKGDFWLLLQSFIFAGGVLVLSSGCLLIYGQVPQLKALLHKKQLASPDHAGYDRPILSWINNNKLLMVLFLCGFALRSLSILWGVPLTDDVGQSHADEPYVLARIIDFPTGYCRGGSEAYGASLQSTIGMFLVPLKYGFKVLSVSYEVYAVIVQIVARVINLMLGSMCIFCVYYLAKIYFSRKVALLSAIFMAISFFHVMNSAVFTLDVPMSLLVLVNLIILNHALVNQRSCGYILLGISSGYLLGTKLYGGIFLALPVFFTLVAPRLLTDKMDRTSTGLWTSVKNLGIYFVVLGAAYLLLNPAAYLDPEAVLHVYSNMQSILMDPVSWKEFTLSSFTQSANAVGSPIIILAAASVVAVEKDKRPGVVLLFLLVVLYYGLFGVHHFIPPARYVIMIAPLFCILAACTCVRLIQARYILLRTVGVAAVVASVGWSLYQCGWGVYLRLYDTRPVASRYIVENVPKGTTLGLGVIYEYTGPHPYLWRYPRINLQNYKEAPVSEKPEIVVASSYDFIPILEALASGKVNTDYVLDQRYHKGWWLGCPPTPNSFRFYDMLFNGKHPQYKLLKSFSRPVGVPIEFWPPEIRIYKKNDVYNMSRAQSVTSKPFA
jgi:hypothetical protein